MIRQAQIAFLCLYLAASVLDAPQEILHLSHAALQVGKRHFGQESDFGAMRHTLYKAAVTAAEAPPLWMAQVATFALTAYALASKQDQAPQIAISLGVLLLDTPTVRVDIEGIMSVNCVLVDVGCEVTVSDSNLLALKGTADVLMEVWHRRGVECFKVFVFIVLYVGAWFFYPVPAPVKAIPL